MNRAIEIIKQNPWKITFGTIITVLITVGSYYFTDMRYVKRSEYEAQKALIEKAIQENHEKLKELSKQ